MAPATKRRTHRRKYFAGRRHGRVLKRSSQGPLLFTGSPGSQSPQFDITGDKPSRKKTKRPFKKTMVPVSDDPLEINIYEHTPLLDGYVFVVKGDVYITRHCRSMTKESGQVVYVVYNKAGKNTLGIRVPATIHAEVVESAAATADSRASAVQDRDTRDRTRARELLRRQFPLMPTDTLDTILNHAFLKGSGRVGRTAMMTEERKAVLAVEAHIRHTHTDYDKLLDAGMNREDARQTVWPVVQAISRAWEGGEGQVLGSLTLPLEL
ncbi:hypothetical protein NUU61_000068 [Penicillium alfredii]|uniref:DUF2293 domain-containing protein n=1 Tax=Penicillium alfredii TaxID=1506179 RepID=A0A9W9G8W1_9EURO|nr:uncharacterized protein NUU61_000068 [Penicillium alfredii]KAJ5114309.1 hypothetical protein NUU61_000068 [Penicillium alfredii]